MLTRVSNSSFRVENSMDSQSRTSSTSSFFPRGLLEPVERAEMSWAWSKRSSSEGNGTGDARIDDSIWMCHDAPALGMSEAPHHRTHRPLHNRSDDESHHAQRRPNHLTMTGILTRPTLHAERNSSHRYKSGQTWFSHWTRRVLSSSPNECSGINKTMFKSFV
jgi:hypothetical protein